MELRAALAAARHRKMDPLLPIPGNREFASIIEVRYLCTLQVDTATYSVVVSVGTRQLTMQEHILGSSVADPDHFDFDSTFYFAAREIEENNCGFKRTVARDFCIAFFHQSTPPGLIGDVLGPFGFFTKLFDLKNLPFGVLYTGQSRIASQKQKHSCETTTIP